MERLLQNDKEWKKFLKNLKLDEAEKLGFLVNLREYRLKSPLSAKLYLLTSSIAKIDQYINNQETPRFDSLNASRKETLSDMLYHSLDLSPPFKTTLYDKLDNLKHAQAKVVQLQLTYERTQFNPKENGQCENELNQGIKNLENLENDLREFCDDWNLKLSKIIQGKFKNFSVDCSSPKEMRKKYLELHRHHFFSKKANQGQTTSAIKFLKTVQSALEEISTFLHEKYPPKLEKPSIYSRLTRVGDN